MHHDKKYEKLEKQAQIPHTFWQTQVDLGAERNSSEDEEEKRSNHVCSSISSIFNAANTLSLASSPFYTLCCVTYFSTSSKNDVNN